jgi:hypothetical protein
MPTKPYTYLVTNANSGAFKQLTTVSEIMPQIFVTVSATSNFAVDAADATAAATQDRVMFPNISYELHRVDPSRLWFRSQGAAATGVQVIGLY